MVTKPFFIYHNYFRSGWAKKILIMHIWQLTLLWSPGPRATTINPSQEDVTALLYSCRFLPFGQSVWYYDPLKIRASHQHFIMHYQLSITFNTIELVPCAYSFEVVHGCPVPVLLDNRRSERPREQSTERPKSLFLGDNSHQIQVLSIL